jgi:hypothetical protein
MRQSDNQVQLAAGLVRAELNLVVPPMQQIRRNTEDKAVGACLEELKRLQLQYMDRVLEVVQPASGEVPDVATREVGLKEASQYHDQFTLEISRLLGTTAAP